MFSTMNINIISIVVLISSSSSISLIRTNQVDTTNECDCKLAALTSVENLERTWRRLRLENPNGLTKYPTRNENLVVGCQTLAVYEKLYPGSKNRTFEKRCRRCAKSGVWTDLSQCEVLRCDRDDFAEHVTFRLAYFEVASARQTLFLPGKVIALVSASKKCLECASNGEWSISSCARLKKLTTPKPLPTCSLDELNRIEYLNFNYVRIRIETDDGWAKINENDVPSRRLPVNTVIVYQRYLSLLSNIQQDMIGSTTTSDPYKLVNPFVRKFCRYCDAATSKWSEPESCVSLSCDPSLLTGSPDFVFVSNQSMINVAKYSLFKSFTVLAVYSYGSQKTCKQCHENGEWSKYASSDLCRLREHNGSLQKLNETTRTGKDSVKVKKLKKFDFTQFYDKENPCLLHDLLENENKSFRNRTRTLLVSPDRRHKYDPKSDSVKLPSRSLSIYKDDRNQTNECSICINGAWSNMCRELYSPNLEFCERDAAIATEQDGSFIFMLDDENEAPESQHLFEPGTVKLVRRLSETTIVCRGCLSGGRWSKYAHSSMCESNEAFFKQFRTTTPKRPTVSLQKNCQIMEIYNDLDFQWSLDNIQSWNARALIDNSSDLIPEFSMSIFINSSSLLPHKYCRRCVNGSWAGPVLPCPIEFTIPKCDPVKLSGVSYFVHVHDGTKLARGRGRGNDDEAASGLVYPGEIAAVYEFGAQKYCKLCHADGTWSSYPQFQLCDFVAWQ